VNVTALEELAARCAAQEGAVLIDLAVRGDRRRPVIEVFIDSPTGVTADLCTKVSRDLQQGLEGLDPAAEYRLVVSSPGADRPLVHPWQYPKHVGRPFRVRAAAGEAREMREVHGTLVEADAEGIVLEGEGRTRIDFASIVEARVALPW
jgi:ribosome maturation factor RimP